MKVLNMPTVIPDSQHLLASLLAASRAPVPQPQPVVQQQPVQPVQQPITSNETHNNLWKLQMLN